MTGGGQDHAVEELKAFGLLTSRCRCEESWLSRMVNAVTIATLNGKLNVPWRSLKAQAQTFGIADRGRPIAEMGTLSSRGGNHHAAAAAAVLMTTMVTNKNSNND